MKRGTQNLTLVITPCALCKHTKQIKVGRVLHSLKLHTTKYIFKIRFSKNNRLESVDNNKKQMVLVMEITLYVIADLSPTITLQSLSNFSICMTDKYDETKEKKSINHSQLFKRISLK